MSQLRLLQRSKHGNYFIELLYLANVQINIIQNNRGKCLIIVFVYLTIALYSVNNKSTTIIY